MCVCAFWLDFTVGDSAFVAALIAGRKFEMDGGRFLVAIRLSVPAMITGEMVEVGCVGWGGGGRSVCVRERAKAANELAPNRMRG